MHTTHWKGGGWVYKTGAQGQGEPLSTPSPSFSTPAPTPTPPLVKLSPFLPCRIPKRSGRPGPGPVARTRWIQSPLVAELIIREWGTGSAEGGREGGRTRCGRPAGGCAGPPPPARAAAEGGARSEREAEPGLWEVLSLFCNPSKIASHSPRP